jgi:hypothetical protein
MKTPVSGKRHPLLFYRRTMDRLWLSTLVLGLLLATLWVWNTIGSTPLVIIKNSFLLFGAAAMTLLFSLFAFLSRYMAYVQVHRDHLQLVTPFLQLRVSYRRILRAFPVEFHILFPKTETGWAQRSFLEPFYGQTALVVKLNAYPMPKSLLRLFLTPQMFSRNTSGLVFMVPDWMGLSTELDSYWSVWQQSQTRPRTLPGSYR